VRFGSDIPGADLTQADIVGPSNVWMPGSDALMLFLGVALTLVGLIVLAGYLILRRRRIRRHMLPPKRRWVVVPGVVVLLGVGTAVWFRPPPVQVPEFPALPRILPAEAFYYSDITSLPIHENSEGMIEAIGGLRLNPAAGSGLRYGAIAGRPFNIADGSTPLEHVNFAYKKNSFEGPYPITDPAFIQSAPTYQMDNHYVAVDFGARRMWEIGNARVYFGRWEADAGTVWDLDSLDFSPGRTTGSGLPILPGLFTYEEVAAGSVDHVISMSLPATAAERHIWPARVTDGTNEDPDAPPMGSWLRLRGDVDLEGLGPQARVVAEALQRHGMVLADTGGSLALNGTPDARWDDSDLATLGKITIDDFEVVDSSVLMVASDSMEARQQEEQE
jgi:hypothetical protein